MPASRSHPAKRRLRLSTIVIIVVVTLALGGVDVMFYFWPFRYRQVYPLLEQTFQGRVVVHHYHRTYFPHPGFVAEDMVLYRPGVNGGAPLGTIGRMTVVGTWSNLLFHPHLLHEIRVDDLTVRIPPPGTKGGGINFAAEVFSPSQQKIQIRTIIADGAILQISRRSGPPFRLRFDSLRIHDVRHNHPLQVDLRCAAPGLGGSLTVSTRLGPFVKNHSAATPLSGTYDLQEGDLGRVHGLAGRLAASGHYTGTLSSLAVHGTAAIPELRVTTGHAVPLHADYDLTVAPLSGDIQIHRAQLKINGNPIAAEGSVTGKPEKIDLTFATTNSNLAALLDIIEEHTPSVEGRVSFHAHAAFTTGPGDFLRKLKLQGHVSVEQVHFVSDSTQDTMNAFSARVRKDPPQHKGQESASDVTASAASDTRFHDGMAYFPDVLVTLPGAKVHLHGTFNLLNTRIRFTGTAALEQGLSHAVTGWKAVLLAPLNPFFHHRRAPAVVPVAVTGTSENPHIGADVFHHK